MMSFKKQKGHSKARGQEKQEHRAGQCHQEQAIVYMSLLVQSQVSTLTTAHVNMQHTLQRLEQGQHEVTILIRTLLNRPVSRMCVTGEGQRGICVYVISLILLFDCRAIL